MFRVPTLTLLAVAAAAAAQPPAPAPAWAYGHDLRARKGGASDFDPQTPKIGVEFYRDAAAGAVLAVTQAGSLAATPAEVGTDKTAPWLFAHDLSVRNRPFQRLTPTFAFPLTCEWYGGAFSHMA